MKADMKKYGVIEGGVGGGGEGLITFSLWKGGPY